MKTTTNRQPHARLNPLNDYLFLKVMGEKGDEVQLLSFLNAVLARSPADRLASVEILESKTLAAAIIGDKTSILDIRALLENGAKVNIEVQLRNLRNMDRRSLFYWSREYAKGLDAGRDYLELPNVIAINIVNFEFLASGGFHTMFRLWEERERTLLLTDALEIHFLDMVKFKKARGKDVAGDPLHRWLTWLDAESPPELVKELARMDMAIQKAEERVTHVSQDKEALRAYEMRQLGLSDFNTAVTYARREGLEAGEKRGEMRGEKRGAEKIARNMKAHGVPLAQIAQFTGLSEAQIRGL